MNIQSNQEAAFGILLRQNPRACAFYEGCTAEQRQAISRQLSSIRSRAQLQGFVDNLPAAAL